ncbi:MAG TPA: hypothetical protein VGR71_04440 [Nitrospira sp.]|nr:hypothetical protein [Nitrospira sp.]
MTPVSEIERVQVSFGGIARYVLSGYYELIAEEFDGLGVEMTE